MTIPETLFVFGHEQGHYVLNHIWLMLTFALLGLLVGMYLAYRSVGVVLARFGRRWAVHDLGDWASLPVLMLLLGVFELIGQPIMANFSRYLEHQADIYGLEVIHGLTPDSRAYSICDGVSTLGSRSSNALHQVVLPKASEEDLGQRPNPRMPERF